jgi:hypothetical protein
MTNTVALKIGDEVTAVYGDSTIRGTISGYDFSGYVYLKFSTPQDLGIRIENDGVALSPGPQRKSMNLVKAGPGLTDEDLVHLPASCVGGCFAK